MSRPMGNNITKGIERGWYTRRQAAERVGRSYDTLQRWEERGIATPSGSHTAGKVTMVLYNTEDINRLRKIAKSVQPGLAITVPNEE